MPEIFDSEDLKKSDEEQEAEPDAAQETQFVPHQPRHVDEYSEVMRNEVSKEDHISWYMPKPKRMTFSTQDSGEHIVLALRQHPITQLRWILLAFGLALLPFLITFAGIFDFLPNRFYFAGVIGWYLVVTGYILESFLKWFYNVYIITDERIIDVDFHSLINRDIAAAKIDKIEDVTALTVGVLAAVFDYGNVIIQTAAEKREFDFPGIPNPNKVSTLINELILEEEREKLEGRAQ